MFEVGSLQTHRVHVVLNPRDKVRDIHVHAWYRVFTKYCNQNLFVNRNISYFLAKLFDHCYFDFTSTVEPPTDNSVQCVPIRPGNLAHERRTTISLARVLPLLPSGADEGRVEPEFRTQCGIS